MSDGGESCEELLNLLHQRLVATGEWNTLLAQLRQLLEESEWDTQLRDQAERTCHNAHPGEARAQDPLHLPTLVAKLGPYAQSRCNVSHRNLAELGARYHVGQDPRLSRPQPRGRLSGATPRAAQGRVRGVGRFLWRDLGFRPVLLRALVHGALHLSEVQNIDFVRLDEQQCEAASAAHPIPCRNRRGVNFGRRRMRRVR